MTKEEVYALHLRITDHLAQCEELQWGRETLADYGALAAYELQVQRLCRHALPESIPTLVLITQQGTQRRQKAQNEGVRNKAQVLRSLDTMALEAARVLLRLAETEPSRAFLPVLKALQQQAQSSHAPLEFIPIRFRLVRLLKRLNNLPIPAHAPFSTENLPIPVDEE